MSLGEKLRRLRKAKGLTQEELSEMIYTTSVAISGWERNVKTPSIESIRLIANVFDVSVEELTGAGDED